jgi:hypothetical protein
MNIPSEILMLLESVKEEMAQLKEELNTFKSIKSFEKPPMKKLMNNDARYGMLITM